VGSLEALWTYLDRDAILQHLPTGHRLFGAFYSDGVDLCIVVERPAPDSPVKGLTTDRQRREAKQREAIARWLALDFRQRLAVSVDPGLVTPLQAVPGNVDGDAFVPARDAAPDRTRTQRRYAARQLWMLDPAAAATAAAAAAAAAAQPPAAPPPTPAVAVAAAAAAGNPRPRDLFVPVTYSAREHAHVTTYAKRARQQEEVLRDAAQNLQGWQSGIPTGNSAQLARLLDRIAHVAPRLQEAVDHYGTW
jgi:hypothetical protein